MKEGVSKKEDELPFHSGNCDQYDYSTEIYVDLPWRVIELICDADGAYSGMDDCIIDLEEFVWHPDEAQFIPDYLKKELVDLKADGVRFVKVTNLVIRGEKGRVYRKDEFDWSINPSVKMQSPLKEDVIVDTIDDDWPASPVKPVEKVKQHQPHVMKPGKEEKDAHIIS